MKQMFVQFRGDNLNRQGVSNFDWSIFEIWIKTRQRNIEGETSLNLLWWTILEVFGKNGIQ